MKLSIVIPALNEEANIGELIAAVHREVPLITPEYEIILVDGGSTDRTKEIAKCLNARVLIRRKEAMVGH